ncbi:MAG: Gfo/Idh/MocA family oxidoreductase [Candidatus Latescibacterota bacterium]|jgi:predicted dehydrogenase|nr:Gfo/Idh/MocA family oxidoreductase [Candidatus Latescibacterota bacterium]MED5414612.1 Gfo/Idh/MocA family oxidoreductase [Candidatus Latescibacterota bacterium]MEE3042704.1 Gfo/Idh/MocA family oxidoreductase [Candidatus Latescibacterota bacterium]MEE3337239.1 Gfo/Idh/MocA family oxidoreductase [Candidatus Latescibacterota bacterium]
MTRLRFGIIGAGGISAILHLPEIASSDEMEVVLVSGRKADRLQKICDDFDVPRWTQSYDDVLSDPEVDAVIVATPHPLHVSWGIKAMAAGKHVLMQKPLCGDMAEANDFVAAVEATDRTVLCMPHFPPHVYDLKARCEAGEIGRVSGARCRTSHGGPEVYYAGVRDVFDEQDEGLWFFDASQASVGALFDMGVYAVATLVAILGSVRRVTGMTTTFDKPTQLEDNAVLIMEMASGALVTAETSWCDPARSRELSLHGTAGKFTMPGSDGAALSRWTPTSYTDERAPVATQTIDPGAGMGNVHEHFLASIRDCSHSDLSNAWAARHVTEIMLAGMAAGRDGGAVDLTTTAEHV